jgi:hypothetical protein
MNKQIKPEPKLPPKKNLFTLANEDLKLVRGGSGIIIQGPKK